MKHVGELKLLQPLCIRWFIVSTVILP